MAAYNFASTLALIQAAGYGTDTASVAVENLAISAAFLELSAERQWSWLRSTATGTLTVGNFLLYPTPATFNITAPLAVRLYLGTTSYEPLEQVDEWSIKRKLHLDAPGAYDVPTEWGWYERTVVVWPRPQLAYSFEFDYVRAPLATEFDGSADLPPIGDILVPVIAWGAIRWLAFRQRDQQSYGIATSEYRAAKAQVEQLDRRGEPGQVKEWTGWGALSSGWQAEW